MRLREEIRRLIRPDIQPFSGALWNSHLKWLIQLRWWALTISLLAWSLVPLVQWPYFDESRFLAGVVIGTIVNAVLWVRVSKKPQIGPLELAFHMLTDVMALTWLLAASGDIKNPFIMLYVVPVMLGTLMLGRSGTMLAIIFSSLGIGILSFQHQWLPTYLKGRLPMIQVACVVCLMATLGYLSLTILKQLKAFEKEHIGLERLATLGRAMQGIAHELNTPLMTMQTLASDMSSVMKSVTLDPAIRGDMVESLDLFEKEVARCGRLTASLLRHNAPEYLSLASERVIEIVEQAVASLGEKPGETVRIQMADRSHRHRTDRDRLQQIIMNLVQNAIQASKEAGRSAPFVDIDIHISRGQTAIDIKDFGAGLKPHIREKLFQPFVTTRPSGEGTGLGLYTAQRLSISVGGHIELLKSDADGTTFQIVLGKK